MVESADLVKYFVKDCDVLYRGAGPVPDQVLHPKGWVPIAGAATISADTYPPIERRGGQGGTLDPETFLTRCSPVSEAEARQVAKEEGLPVEGW